MTHFLSLGQVGTQDGTDEKNERNTVRKQGRSDGVFSAIKGAYKQARTRARFGAKFRRSFEGVYSAERPGWPTICRCGLGRRHGRARQPQPKRGAEGAVACY